MNIILREYIRSILSEVSETESDLQGRKPKAILMAGSAGSGKGCVVDLISTMHAELKVLDPDKIFKELMNNTTERPVGADGGPVGGSSIIPLARSSQNPTQFSIAATFKNLATKRHTQKFLDHASGHQWFILDGTSASGPKTKAKKDLLEGNGFDVMMVYVDAHHDVAQERNIARGRDPNKHSWHPQAVTKSWNNLNLPTSEKGPRARKAATNVGINEDESLKQYYARLFGNNFVIADNNPAGVEPTLPQDSSKCPIPEPLNWNEIRSKIESFLRS